MNKLCVLFILVGFVLVGCSQKQESKISASPIESKSETVTSTKVSTIDLKETEEIDLFKKAVNESIKEPGIVNMTNPQYQFSIGKESFFLWIAEESGTIMNTKDTHTIYSLSRSSVEEIYEYVNND